MSLMRRAFSNSVLGVIFIGLIALGLWLVIGVFTQRFISFDRVTLRTDTIGLQLPAEADVKIRGVLVGEVLKMQATPDGGATLTLGIHPDKMAEIPANVTASILPKTLFGEKYVELNIPKGAARTALASGDMISQTKQPIEVESVLADLYPLLRAIQPAELDYTLNALATALDGRGNELGETIDNLDAYLKRLNPETPELIHDLDLLSKVSNTYADAVPALSDTLRNTVKTTSTLESKHAALHQLLTDVASFSDTAKGFLDTNGDNLIELGKLTQPQAALLARYSPEFPCLLEGLVDQIPRLANTFRNFIFHINVVIVSKQPRGYGVQDKPVNGATNGPNCALLPHPPGNADHPYGQAVTVNGKTTYPNGHIPNVRDGVDDNGGTLGRGDGQRVATEFGQISTTMIGTPEQRAIIAALTAPALGVPADQVPDITDLLFAPVAAGTEVSSR